ncbi:FAD-dependent oxidoreductase, partial [Klebsiella pneumoniae]|uniref:FAD-dependent oxidoreductase n=1 Tax=Klebsiella pneumoniae TaxID=573 RepID=UPI003C6D99DF
MNGSGRSRYPIVVVGAGVAGITATLDLAGAGRSVHLVEKEAAIGGQTARL